MDFWRGPRNLLPCLLQFCHMLATLPVQPPLNLLVNQVIWKVDIFGQLNWAQLYYHMIDGLIIEKIDILDKRYNKCFFPIKCHNISWPCQDRVTNINDKFIEAKRGIFGQWIIYQNKLVICGFNVFGDASPSLWYD